MDIGETPQVLEGQTSIEDLLGGTALPVADALPLQGCLPGLEDVPCAAPEGAFRSGAARQLHRLP